MTMHAAHPPAGRWADDRGAASAELALVIPILFALMCGSFDLATYFLHEHVVVKAVRDGARYASRQNFSQYTCGGIAADAAQDIRDITRTGMLEPPLDGTKDRLKYWSKATEGTISISVACTGGYSGIYEGLSLGSAPVVTVSASVPYTSLFGLLGFDTTGLALNAKSESAVMGI